MITKLHNALHEPLQNLQKPNRTIAEPHKTSWNQYRTIAEPQNLTELAQNHCGTLKTL